MQLAGRSRDLSGRPTMPFANRNHDLIDVRWFDTLPSAFDAMPLANRNQVYNTFVALPSAIDAKPLADRNWVPCGRPTLP